MLPACSMAMLDKTIHRLKYRVFQDIPDAVQVFPIRLMSTRNLQASRKAPDTSLLMNSRSSLLPFLGQ